MHRPVRNGIVLMTRIAFILCFLTASKLFAEPGEKPVVRTDAFGDPLPEGAMARLGSVRWKGDEFHGLVFSADGKRVAAYGKDPPSNLSARVIYVWEFPSGRLLKRFKGPEWLYAQFTFSPDSKSLIISETTFVDYTAIFHLETGELEKVTFDRPDEASGGGREVTNGTRSVHSFSEGKKRHLAMIDALHPKEFRPLGSIEVDHDALHQVALSSDGRWVVACESGGNGASYKLRIFDSICRKSWPGPPLPSDAANIAVSFLRSDRLLVTCDEQGGWGTTHSDYIWNIDSKGKNSRPDFQFVGRSTYPVHWEIMGGSISYSPSGNLSAGCTGVGSLVVYDTLKGTALWQRAIGGSDRESDGVRNTTFSPDGKTLAVTAHGESVVRFFDAATGRDLNTGFGHQGAVTSLAFHPSGKMLLSASRADSTVRCWDLTQTSRRQSATLSETPIYGKLAFADRGRLLPFHQLTNTEDEVITVWDTDRLRVLGALPIAKRDFDSDLGGNWMIVSPETSLVAMAMRHANGGFDLIDARRGALLKHVEPVAEYWTPLAFSPDGKTLIGHHPEDGLVFCDLATGRKRDAPTVHSTNVVQRYVIYGHGVVRICDRARGRIVLEFESSANSVVISGDGRYLATARSELPISTASTNDKARLDKIEIIETASGRTVRKIRVPCQRVFALAFSPDSTLIAAGGSDGTILLYPLQSLGTAGIDSIQASDLYVNLASEDTEKAFAAVGTLSANQREAIEVIRARLLVLPQKEETPDEKKVAPAPLSGRRLQTWRAIEVLERIGSREACDLLKELRGGADPWLTELAGDALLRLSPRR
jgi:WD40 repeat protein